MPTISTRLNSSKEKMWASGLMQNQYSILNSTQWILIFTLLWSFCIHCVDNLLSHKLQKAMPSRTSSESLLKLHTDGKWSLESASELLHDLKEYHLCKGLFVGGKADAKDWWEELLIKGTIHLLKTFAIQIFMIVPHVTEVEQLFSKSQQHPRCQTL